MPTNMKRMRRLGMTNTGQIYAQNRINIDMAERGGGERKPQQFQFPGLAEYRCGRGFRSNNSAIQNSNILKDFPLKSVS